MPASQRGVACADEIAGIVVLEIGNVFPEIPHVSMVVLSVPVECVLPHEAALEDPVADNSSRNTRDGAGIVQHLDNHGLKRGLVGFRVDILNMERRNRGPA